METEAAVEDLGLGLESLGIASPETSQLFMARRALGPQLGGGGTPSPELANSNNRLSRLRKAGKGPGDEAYEVELRIHEQILQEPTI